jgi:hypothetical protein
MVSAIASRKCDAAVLSRLLEAQGSIVILPEQPNRPSFSIGLQWHILNDIAANRKTPVEGAAVRNDCRPTPNNFWSISIEI